MKALETTQYLTIFQNMNNFLELTDIDTQNQLTIITDTPVTVNGQEVTESIQLDLLSDIVLLGNNIPAQLTINNLEILPKFQHLAQWENGWRLEITGPFYIWYFYATFQGFIA